MRKRVVLHSGGLDSTTTLAMAMDLGSLKPDYEFHTLNVLYGQRHKREAKAAEDISKWYKEKGIPIVCHTADLKLTWQGSALLHSAEVPKDRDESTMAQGIPVTYVPARNTFLLGLASSLAEAIGAENIFVGFNAVDYSGYPDCRPEFVDAFNNTIKVGTKAGVEGNSIEVVAPIIKMSKAEIISIGLKLGVPFHLTWSCYEGAETPCRRCDSCIIRENGFKACGMTDPLLNP